MSLPYRRGRRSTAPAATSAPGPLHATTAVCCALLLASSWGCSSTSPTEPAGSLTLLVDPTGAGDYTAIQPALNAADDGDTVLVTPGAYTGGSNRDLDFGGKDIVLMAAAGRESVVIDCEGQGRGFYLHGGEGRDAIIDGFIITNGTAYRGAGAYLDGASPTIRNSVFSGNSTEQDGYGGGMYVKNGSSPSLSNVVFEENTAGFSGGGLMCDPYCSPALSHVDFRDNESSGSGGGISCVLCDGLTLFEVEFIGNAASSSGGGIYCGSSDLSIDEASFLGNSARDGGAISLSGSSPSISHATIADNECIDGGGIHCTGGSSPTIRTSVIAFNLGEGSVFCADELSEPDTRRCCLYANFVTDIPCGTYDNLLYEDPLFCGLPDYDVTFCANSPCLPDGNTWGIRLGDRGQGCEDCGSSIGSAPIRPLVGRIPPPL